MHVHAARTAAPRTGSFQPAARTSAGARGLSRPPGVHRTIGNYQTGELMRQAASPVPASEGVGVERGPVIFGRSQEELARRRRVADAAEQRFSIVARTFIDEAFEWAFRGERLAVTTVDDPAVKENFYRALAGNMLWASTAIFAAWNPVVIPMSFVGAAVGSGAAAVDSALPRGEELLVLRWAREAHQLQSESGPLVVRAAELAAAADIPEWSYDRLDRMLWQVMFPAIPWESREETIVRTAQERVQHALSGFLSQYQAWKAEIVGCMSWKIPTSPDDAWMELVLPDPRAECERIHPFRPTLDFGLNLSGATGPE